MYVKKVKRKCGVRGCKNTESYAFSRTREVGNSVIICRDCLADALAASADTEQAAGESSAAKKDTAAPPLFFNAAALGVPTEQAESEDTAEPPENDDEAEDAEEDAGYVCAVCGKAFTSAKGLNAHRRYCKAQE
jgi:hypothetical protein